MPRRFLSLLILPLLVAPLLVAGCGGGGGDDDATSANVFSFSGTRGGTADFYQDDVPSTIIKDVPVTGTISRDGSFRFVILAVQGETDTLTGKVDANGVVTTATYRVDRESGTDYTLNGRGTISLSGTTRTFNLGFTGNDNEDPNDFNDFQYIGTLN